MTNKPTSPEFMTIEELKAAMLSKIITRKQLKQKRREAALKGWKKQREKSE